MAGSLPFKQRFNLGRFFRYVPAIDGTVKLNRRRIYILPTQRGMGMVLTIVLLWLMGFVYNNNLVYLLAFLLASVFFVTILHTYKALAGLEVSAGYVSPVFVGEMARLPVAVNNPDGEERPALSIALFGEQDFSLSVYESRTLGMLLPVQRRGWQAMGTVTLTTVYPFGIFRAWAPLRFDRKVLVYPSQLKRAVPLPLPSAGERSKNATRHLAGNGRDEFNGIRDYQPGDSLRQIHWRAYAKGQGLLIKQYACEVGGSELWLDFQQAPGGQVEERLSVLCRWILDAEAAGFRYGLRLPTRQLAPNQGAKHQSDCLEALALF